MKNNNNSDYEQKTKSNNNKQKKQLAMKLSGPTKYQNILRCQFQFILASTFKAR